MSIASMYEKSFSAYAETSKKLIVVGSTLEEKLRDAEVRESELVRGGLLDGKNEQQRKAQLNDLMLVEHTAISSLKTEKKALEIELDVLRREMDMYESFLYAGVQE